MLISILKLDLTASITSINLKNIETLKNVKKEYRKNLDLLIFLCPNHTINAKVCKAPFDDVKRRNVMYLAKVFSQSLNSDENHKILKDRKFYQLNINSENSNFGEDSWYIRSTNTGKIAIDDIAFYI